MNYLEQTSDTIRYCLAEGEFDLEQFNILKTKNVHWDDIKLQVHILGESHFLQFLSKDMILNEVCACTEITTPPEGNVFNNDFLSTSDNETIETEFSTYSYTFNSKYYDWSDGIKLLNECILKEAQSIDVTESSYIFPSAEGKNDLPLTQIFVSAKENLSIHTFHTYPNEQKIVYTHSILKKS